MTLSHPVLFAIGLIVALLAIVSLPKHGLAFCAISIGLLLIATAAGGLTISLHPSRQITALVDLSPSTRGAAFRNRSALLHRISELAGNLPVRILSFSDHVEDLPTAAVLPDLDCEQTRYDPPAANAILLFSDGRFAIPDSGDPTYPVIDSLLIDPPDAAVTEMHFDSSATTATVQDRGSNRELTWSGTTENKPVPVSNGSSIIHGGNATGTLVEARLNGGDLWPENDSLALPTQPPPLLAKWWIGAGSPPPDWTTLKPADLPSDATDYLNPGVIALSNIPADHLSQTQQQRLLQYVRDLGGSLMIFGGDHAFTAGNYSQSQLDSLSPLASDPPTPTTQWMLVIDSSGSMAESSNGHSRWTAAVDAALRVLSALPSKDIVSVGSFARDLSWWIDGQPATIARRLTSPPPGVGPNGPTNLQPVLSQISKRRDSMPCEVLLLTDADTTIDDPRALAAALRAAKVRISLLALANVAADNPVVQIVTATGGHLIQTDDPSRWSDSLRQLMQSAAPSELQNTKVQLQFDPPLPLATRSLDLWNRTWMRPQSTQLASADVMDQPLPLAARWHVGVGSVAAFAFTPTTEEASALATELVQTPRDPSLKLDWQCDTMIKVSVDASSDAGYINDLRFTLTLSDQPSQPLHQIEPGRYSIEIPALRAPTLATIQLDGHVIDRRAIAGRYAPEFDAIGNDNAALLELAARTGGEVIAPSQHTPIPFNWPPKLVRIDTYLAAAGAILLATGLIPLLSAIRPSKLNTRAQQRP